MKAKNSIDMIHGSLWGKIFKFAVPLILTGMLQRFYNAADVIVVGRYAGHEALAGVGTTSSVTAFLLEITMGLSVGASVVLGRALGRDDKESASKIVHTSMLVSFIGGLLMAFVCVGFAEPLLNMINVPDNVMGQAKIYLQIYSVGSVFSLIYNFGASILRAKGDTKRALYIVTVSGIVNVVLNLVFVVGFGMKADGVAIATLIANLINAVSVVYILCREEDAVKLDLRKLCIDKKQFPLIVRDGIPSGIQGSVFSLSNIIIQSNINSFGDAAIAGNTASANIGAFLLVMLNAFYQASLAFVSQNYGAKKYDRIKKTVYVCVAYSVVLWAIQAAVVFVFNRQLISIYAPGDAEAIAYGMLKNIRVCLLYGLCGLMNTMSGALRGMGASISSMIVSVAGVCGIRILWIVTAFRANPTFEMLCLCYPLSWIGTLAMHTLMFCVMYRKYRRQERLTLKTV